MPATKRSITISSARLAEWLDAQADTWWIVHVDPVLTGEVNFPCPNDELAEALRKHDNDITLFVPKVPMPRASAALNALALDELMDTKNIHEERTILAAWKGSGIEWLLSEDKEMAEEAKRDAAEAVNAQTSN